MLEVKFFIFIVGLVLIYFGACIALSEFCEGNFFPGVLGMVSLFIGALFIIMAIELNFYQKNYYDVKAKVLKYTIEIEPQNGQNKEVVHTVFIVNEDETEITYTINGVYDSDNMYKLTLCDNGTSNTNDDEIVVVWSVAKELCESNMGFVNVEGVG